MRTAQVAVPGVEGAFSYRIPAHVSAHLSPGMRVLVPFGSRRLTGFVVEVDTTENPRATKALEFVLDAEPVFSTEMLEFTRWIADYYVCPWGDVLKAALPAGTTLDEQRYWLATAQEADALTLETLPEESRKIYDVLAAAPLSGEQMRRRFGLDTASPPLRKLRSLGLIDYRPQLRAPSTKTKYDHVLTLSERALAEYETNLFPRLRSVHQQQLLRELHDFAPEGISRSELLRGATAARRNALNRLLELGWIRAEKTEQIRWLPDHETAPHTTAPLALTAPQTEAIERIKAAHHSGSPRPLLLFGVTGSGKTQVYIEAIRAVIARGKSALVLLPEIALTPFLWSRFRTAFDQQVAIQHSAQSPATRYDLWRQIQAGKYSVVIGARSAIFAPLQNLGLIVVDEEHEASFKQTESPPCYHARDCALVRARISNATVVLGSATPSMETYHQALQGKYELLELPQRVGGAELPEIRVVNWKPEEVPGPESEPWKKQAQKSPQPEPAEPPILTPELRAALERILAEQRQAILLQNRRGFAPFLICRTCGHIPMCPNCSVSQTFHRKGGTLRCHYCDFRDAAPARCPRCGSAEWIRYGIGTQKLEDELAAAFPAARILRMDSDTSRGHGKHSAMVTSFARHDYDFLVGTQMVAKGLDFSGVDLSAVVRADAELFFPDFRASERGASLILQLAGRAGRRDRRGHVIIQSSAIDHPVLKAVLHGDWAEFARTELEQRDRSSFPPFSRLILLRAVAAEESICARALLKLRRLLQEDSMIDVLGPTPAVVVKVENKFRYCLLARTRRESDRSGARLRAGVKSALNKFRETKAEAKVVLEVDVDPQTSY